MKHRTLAIASIIRSIAAEHARRVPPESARVVSITDVKLAPDLSEAIVFVSALEGGENAVRFLRKNEGAIRASIGKKVKAFRMPVLHFKTDDSAERSARIDRLLEKGTLKNDN